MDKRQKLIPYTKEEIAKLAWNAAQQGEWSNEMPTTLGIEPTIENLSIWERNYRNSELHKSGG